MKVKRVTGRGTGTRKEETSDAKWAGDNFREVQRKRKEAAKDTVVQTGRGTGRRRLGEVPDPAPRPSTEGRTRVTNRGTGIRKSKNKGTKK